MENINIEEYQLNKSKKPLVKIKVIGIGGGGNNAINRMIEDKIAGVDFIAINTEKKILDRSKTTNVIQIGKEITNGIGTGGNPELGEKAAKAEETQIQEALAGADMVFITAGLGGGTGTGAIQVIAELAKKMGILTIGIVTRPFTFEGKKRLYNAQITIEKLKKTVDALIVISNDKLLKSVDKSTTIKQAFEIADSILRQGVEGLTTLITTTGVVNVDFADVKTIMSNTGLAHMGIGSASGEDRAKEAIKHATENPLTETTIKGAKGIIVNVTGSSGLTLDEVNDAVLMIEEEADPDANIIFGTVIDDRYEDEVSITVIATGIEKLQQ